MPLEFCRQLDVKKKYRLYRRFLSLFIPFFFALSAVVGWIFRSKMEATFIVGYFLCGVITSGLTWTIIAHICRKGGTETWTVADGRVKHDSPSSLLGKSFDVALDEIVDVRIGDTECAELKLLDGSHVEFLLNDSESSDFYKFLKKNVGLS